jgi:hypothetical protein
MHSEAAVVCDSRQPNACQAAVGGDSQQTLSCRSSCRETASNRTLSGQQLSMIRMTASETMHAEAAVVRQPATECIECSCRSNGEPCNRRQLSRDSQPPNAWAPIARRPRTRGAAVVKQPATLVLPKRPKWEGGSCRGTASLPPPGARKQLSSVTAGDPAPP